MSEAFAKFDLRGRGAVVTGGGTGMGYYMARGLARSGADVIIAARREEVIKESAARMAEEAQGGGRVLHQAVDLSDREQVADFAQHAIDTLDGVDIFVGNAGQDYFSPLDEIPDTTLDQVFRVNVSANIELTRAFLPRMRAAKWGRILFSSSSTSVRGPAQEGCSVYAASKGALNAFVHTAAAEVGRDGITVNSMLLGVYRTEMLDAQFASMPDDVSKAFDEAYSSMTCVGRLGYSEEVEGLVQFLASNAGSYITGANIAADGGLASMLRPNPVSG